MKRNSSFKLGALLVLTLAFFTGTTKTPAPVEAQAAVNNINIYFFHVDGCPHCEAEIHFLDSYTPTKLNVSLISYNIADDASYNLLVEAADVFDEEFAATPFTVIGGKHYVGFNANVETSIRRVVERYSTEGFVDVMDKIINHQEVLPSDLDTTSDYVFTLPLFGDVDVRDVSLFFVSLMLGLIDGFNPCAMWVLVFLISMLISMEDRKRVWLLGGTFLLTTAVFYFLVMFSWVQALSFIASKTVFQWIIGGIAILAGGYNVFRYIKAKIKKEDGCDVTDVKTKKSLVEKIKKVATNNSFWLALVGVIGIALLVNLIELACSTGLPVLFSQILALNGLSGLSTLFYILVYLFFFMLDDVLVFAISVWTFKVSPISNKFTKYSHLVGGILMTIIGILMIFFPSVLMFAF